MKHSRRDFLSAASTAGLVSLPFLSRIAGAQGLGLGVRGTSDDPHFFLFVQVYGAWDVCLAFDPKDRELLLPNGEKLFDQPYAMNEVREFNGIKLAPHGFALGKYSDRMAIINGIDMEVDNGHSPDIVMTGVQGARQAGAPYVQAVLARRHPYLKQCNVPHIYLDYDGQFIAGAYASSSLSATAKDFVSFTGSSDGGAGDIGTLQFMLDDYKNALPQSRRQVFGGYTGAVQSALGVNARLKQYGFKAPGNIDKPVGTGNFIGQMFASGALGSATLSMGLFSTGLNSFNFDTHSEHYARHPLKTAIEQVDVICGELKKVKLDENHSVFDRTTIIMTAEYARSPRLVGGDGKDHNFRTNSLLALGHKVPVGVYGMSGIRKEGDEYQSHAGLPIDFKTGRVGGNDAKLLHAKNIWAGLGGLAGVDISGEFGADTLPIKFWG